METPKKSLCKNGPRPQRSVLRSLIRRLSSGSGGSGKVSRAEDSRSYSSTVSVSGSSGSSGGRGNHSRRASRDASPTSNLAPVISSDVNAAVAVNTTLGHPVTPPYACQDWRRLVGSIRRKVRRKTPSSSPSIIDSHAHHNDTKNQDDFLKATMRIFLVVSPPMARVQVRHFRV